jgi:hypothetical protein
MTKTSYLPEKLNVSSSFSQSLALNRTKMKITGNFLVHFLGTFSVIRCVLWTILIPVTMSTFNEILTESLKDSWRQSFGIFHQFYVIFAIFSYFKLCEGLEHVSHNFPALSSRLKSSLNRKIRSS